MSVYCRCMETLSGNIQEHVIVTIINFNRQYRGMIESTLYDL